MNKIEAAAKLADELRELAHNVELAAQGDKDARKKVADHIDGYWFALVIGRGVVQNIISDEEEG